MAATETKLEGFQEPDPVKAKGNGKAKAEDIAARKHLYEKLAEIMGRVARVPKRGYNAHFKYQFTTESDLSDHIRPMLAEAGIGLSFGVTEVMDLEHDQVQVRCEVTLSDGITEITRPIYGRAQDKGDKGIYKAITGAVKYWLFKTFLVSTGDDPENDAAADAPQGERETSQNPEEAKRKADYDQYLVDAGAMRKLATIAALDGYVKDHDAAFKASTYYTNYQMLYKELKNFLTPRAGQAAAN